MNLKFILGLAFILKSTFFLQGQTVWTLTDCIEYAHTHNLQIKRQELQAEVANNDYFQSKMSILPDLNFNASRNYNFGRQVDPFTNEFIADNTISDKYNLSAQLNIFSGLQTYNSIKANKYNMLSRMQEVEKEKINITLEIASAYLKILFNQELKEVADSQLYVTKLQVERTDKLVEAGNAARGDLLEIQAQLAAEMLNVTNSQNQLNLSYLNLTQLLDLDSVGGFEVFVPDTIHPDFGKTIITPYQVYIEAMTYLPHVKSAEYMLSAQERNLAIQKGRLSPQLSFNGSWNTGYSDNRRLATGEFSEKEIGYLQNNPSEIVVTQSPVYDDYNYSDQLNDNSSKSLYFSLRIPIFNRWQSMNAIDNAKIQVLDAETSLDQTKQQLYKEIQQAYNDAVSARDKYFSSVEAVSSYREAFNYTEQKLAVGIVNSVEYNIAKNNYIRAQSDLVQAKYEYVFSVKILDFYRGIPITL